MTTHNPLVPPSAATVAAHASAELNTAPADAAWIHLTAVRDLAATLRPVANAATLALCDKAVAAAWADYQKAAAR
jgi:hypothetical protein